MKLNRTKLWMVGTAVFVVVMLVVMYRSADAEKKTLDDESRSALPGQFVELSNGVVHYELAGPEDGPTVVLVHGFSVPYYVWDPTFDALVDAGFQVLRYDLYGRGYSDRPEVEYSADLFVRQLGELLDVLHINEPFSLVGLSFGGPIVVRFANQYPDKVSGLILIAPQVSTVSAAEVFPMNLPAVGELIMAAYIAPIMLPKTQKDDLYKPERFSGWEDVYREQMQYAGFKRAILSSIRNMVGVDNISEYETLGKNNHPTALFWGSEDETVNAVEMEIVRDAIPGVAFYSIEKAGHIAHYERPEAINPLLVGFLRRAEEGIR